MRRPVVTTVLSAALVLANAGSAGAAAVSFTDARGDAPARFDLTRVSVVNADARFTVTTRVRDLRVSGTQVFGFSLRPTGGDTTYMVYTVRRPSGHVHSRLDGYTDGGNVLHLRCAIRARWAPAQDTIRVTLPRDCFTTGRVRTNAYIGAGDGTAGDPWDWTRAVTVGQG